MEATVCWLSQSDSVPAQWDKRCRSLNIRDVSSLHRLKAKVYHVELSSGTTARDITTKSQQHYQAKNSSVLSSPSPPERVRLFMSQPFVNLYGKSLAGHIPLHVPVCVFPGSHTHFPVSVTSSNTLRRKKSLINVGNGSRQTHGLICEQTHTAEEWNGLWRYFSASFTQIIYYLLARIWFEVENILLPGGTCVCGLIQLWGADTREQWGENRGSNPQQLLPLLWTALYWVLLIQFILRLSRWLIYRKVKHLFLLHPLQASSGQRIW